MGLTVTDSQRKDMKPGERIAYKIWTGRRGHSKGTTLASRYCERRSHAAEQVAAAIGANPRVLWDYLTIIEAIRSADGKVFTSMIDFSGKNTYWLVNQQPGATPKEQKANAVQAMLRECYRLDQDDPAASSPTETARELAPDPTLQAAWDKIATDHPELVTPGAAQP